MSRVALKAYSTPPVCPPLSGGALAPRSVLRCCCRLRCCWIVGARVPPISSHTPLLPFPRPFPRARLLQRPLHVWRLRSMQGGALLSGPPVSVARVVDVDAWSFLRHPLCKGRRSPAFGPSSRRRLRCCCWLRCCWIVASLAPPALSPSSPPRLLPQSCPRCHLEPLRQLRGGPRWTFAPVAFRWWWC
ncbi:hypothetical protein BDR26DRAFT_860663 [Obelidium mucronatum]|nr:hypothetical protein BDR26DRAFT_860663 [Obelidium mucronatum]